ncbi:hypothetical protein ASD83_12890 [Devosia sp. Root685]|nr:hypothetical protein ASD83_12890 [Devosia sp. Root685]
METSMSESPFKLNRTRIFILAMGALVVLIGISMMMGGLGSYQELREAANAAREPVAEPAGQ